MKWKYVKNDFKKILYCWAGEYDNFYPNLSSDYKLKRSLKFCRKLWENRITTFNTKSIKYNNKNKFITLSICYLWRKFSLRYYKITNDNWLLISKELNFNLNKYIKNNYNYSPFNTIQNVFDNAVKEILKGLPNFEFNMVFSVKNQDEIISVEDLKEEFKYFN